MENLNLIETSTCLSASVNKLIIQNTSCEARDENVLNQQKLLDFPYISSKLPAPIEDESYSGDPVEYFHECTRALAPMMNSVEDFMNQLPREQLQKQFENYLIWTDQTNVLLDLWKSLYYEDSVSEMLVLLVTTAVLERALGDIYLSKGPAPCPSMLKDLLVTKQLQHIVGKEVIQVLRILIGPPTSLNLRNIVWHGFPSPGEIPRRCILFIVLLVPSIGQVLHDQGITVIDHREPVQLPSMVNLSDHSFVWKDTDSWMEQLSLSTFVSWDTKPFWGRVIALLQDFRYAPVCALLLCYLEHGLRRVFAAANNCHHRVLTAETTSLFTTFDEILDSTLPDGSSNQLLRFIGSPTLELLMDLFMYQDGPRLRDHLSHGELGWEPSTISIEIAQNLFIVTLFLAAKFIPAACKSKICELDIISDDISSYKVQFHRIAVIQGLVHENIKIACSIDDHVTILPDLSRRSQGVLYPLSEIYIEVEANVRILAELVYQNWTTCKIANICDSLTYQTLNKLSKDVKDISTHKIPTLYREKQTARRDVGQINREGKLLSLLYHITTECRDVLKNILTNALARQKQLENKQLRSRQRENYQKFLSSFPCYVLIMCVCSVLVQWQLHHLDAHNMCTQHSVKHRVKFWKSMLQLCENLRTFSHQDKNKWNEGQDLIMKFLRSVYSTFSSVLLLQHTSNCS